MATEIEVRKLKKGDSISYCSSDDITVIKTIIFDNPNDFKNRHGDRVTINGLHWSFVDITII